jgi:AraC-like DNA-binding protein
VHPSRNLQLETLPSAGRLFLIGHFSVPHFPFLWHYHPEVELTFIKRGRGVRYVGHSVERYEAGDLCLLGANLAHTWQCAPNGGPFEPIYIQFLPATWGEGFWRLPEIRTLDALLEQSRAGLVVEDGAARKRAAEILLALVEMPLSSPRRPGVFLDLLADLAERGRFRALNAVATPVQPAGRDISRLCAVLHYIQEHYAREIDYAEAARRAQLSPPAFCRFFRRHLGKTLGDYINEVRVMRACRDLVDTDCDITGIAFGCGFTNLAHFNERFRRLTNRTPRDYRRLAASGLERIR